MASFGLISAIERFDLSRDIKFETYAIMRIKGAIIDDAALASTRVPTQRQQLAGKGGRARTTPKLEHLLQRAPTDQEIADEMGITPRRTQRLAARDLALVDRGAGREWSVSDSSGDQGLDDGHDRGPERARPFARARNVGRLKDLHRGLDREAP